MNQPKLRFKNNDGNSFNDWKKYKLNKIGTHYNGLSGKTKDDFGEGVPYISYLDIFENTVIDFIPESLVKVNSNEKQNVVKKGDIFFTISSETPEEVGIASVYNGQDTELYLNSFSFGFRPNNYDPENSIFLSYFFRSPAFRKVLNKLVQGSTRFNLSKIKLLESVINIPSDIKERKKIADFLSTVDRRIDLQRQLVDETRRLKTSVSQMLFSQKVRFKDDDGTDFPEWESKRLFDVGEITTGTTPSTKVRKYYGSDFLWITPTDIKNKEIKTTEKKLSKEGLAKGRRIPANSVLVTCIASIGKNCVLREEGSCNQQINAITPFNEIDVDFLYYLICFNEPLMHRYAGQGGMEMLNKEQFGNLVMDIPSFKEQLKIGKILTTLDNKIKKEENKLTELKNLKKGLLQQMFV